MRRTVLLAGFALSAIACAPAYGQQDAPDADSTIVVTGEQPSWSEVTRQARDITQPSGIRHAPLPRFEGDRLCPGVLGLKQDHAMLVVDRIRWNAERFGLWMTEDDGTCTPNFLVAFVDDGQETLQRIAEERYWLFSDMPRHERLALLAEEGPVHVWTTTQARTSGGTPLARREDGRQVSAMSSGGVARAALPVREDITDVLVLFNREGVRGKTLIQLADYATMRGLARTRAAEGDGRAMDTILALFDADDTGPPELTAFDLAYLGALYDGPANVAGLAKVGSVSRQLRRNAEAEAEKPRE